MNFIESVQSYSILENNSSSTVRKYATAILYKNNCLTREKKTHEGNENNFLARFQCHLKH